METNTSQALTPPVEAAPTQTFWSRLAAMARWMDEEDGEPEQ